MSLCGYNNKNYIFAFMNNTQLLKFDIIGDNRGSLVSLEQLKNIPFDIKRIYYIFDTKREVTRGNHAHKKIEQVLVSICGSCSIILDNGTEKKKVDLNYPNVGLYIGKNIWSSMENFSQGCVLMVLASDFYDPSEYIRDYKKFTSKVIS